MKTTMRRLIQQLSMAVFPVLLIVLLAGIMFYLLHDGSSNSASDAGSYQEQGQLPAYSLGPISTDAANYPKGYPVVFSRIADPSGWRHPFPVPEPSEEYTVANPVTVWLAIGGGLRFAEEGGLPQLNYGHLHVLIDSQLPGPFDTIYADDAHIDLGDASHVFTLPTLSPGEHQISGVWTDSRNNTRAPLAYSTIKIYVARDFITPAAQTPAASPVQSDSPLQQSPEEAVANCSTSATLDDSYPPRSGTVSVTGVLSCVGVSPDATGMHSIWRYKDRTATCDSTSSADGVASCARDVGDAASAEAVQIEVSFSVTPALGGQKYSAATSFTAQ